MINENNINFIEDINPVDNSITEIKEEVVTQTPEQTQINQNNDYIKELPKWDINPPLEINRSEQ